jgi:hypothetical protein
VEAILVPLMPLFATLPVAVAAAWIVHRVLRHRERMVGSRREVDELRQEIESLAAAQGELQERLDFNERVLR